MQKQGISVSSTLKKVIDMVTSGNKKESTTTEEYNNEEDECEDQMYNESDEIGIFESLENVPTRSSTSSNRSDEVASDGFNKDELDTLALFIIREIMGIFTKKEKKNDNDKDQNNTNENQINKEEEKTSSDCNDDAFLKQINITPKRIMYDYRLLHYSFQHMKSQHPQIFDTNNELVKMAESYFESVISLCVQPIDNCIEKGNIAIVEIMLYGSMF
jgi:hypothetical protein